MRWQDEQEDEEDLDDSDDPLESDMDEHDDPEEIPCPHCGKPIVEFAELCPHCRRYVSDEDAPHPRQTGWKWTVVVALVLVFSGLIYFLLAIVF